MKHFLLPITVMLTSIVLMASCGNSTQKKAEASTQVTNQETKLVGNDRDEHGCIGSAGYQWSVLLKDCIRPFEKGIRMKAAKDDHGQAAYLVFNNDSTQVELFMPKTNNHPILTRTKDFDGSIFWIGEQESGVSVRCIENIWGIYLREELQYVNL